LSDKSDKPNPIFLSIDDAATALGLSPWSIKQELRRGTLCARKNGRRTVIEYSSVKELAASLPVARFAAPTRRKHVSTEMESA
jgi:hypothetical protein